MSRQHLSYFIMFKGGVIEFTHIRWMSLNSASKSKAYLFHSLFLQFM